MILSEDRQTHLAHVITDGIWKEDIVDFNDDDAAIKIAKRAIIKWVQSSEDIDEKVRLKVASLKRNIDEGSPEWDVMYRKYYEEELKRRG